MARSRNSSRGAFSPLAVSVLQLGCGVQTPAAAQPLPAPSPRVPAFVTPGTFVNPILSSGADPWMIFKDGYYYYTQTTGNNITVWKSRTITGLRDAEKRVVWQPPASGANSRNLWAPELHHLDGRWYIYYAADDGRNENHRLFVLEAATDDPLGSYVDKGKISDPSDRWAIDGTILEHEGARYLIWSGWEGHRDGEQNLYIARMRTPWSLEGRRVVISRPSEPWEHEAGMGPRVNEGPSVLRRNGRIHVVYSADQSWTDNYKLGLLSFLGGDPLDSSRWKKAPFPVFSSFVNGERSVFAPGHCSFVTSPDGTENWILYHTARQSGSGWKRHVRAQPFSWTRDDVPVFSVPVPDGVPLAVPSGERLIFELAVEEELLSEIGGERREAL